MGDAVQTHETPRCPPPCSPGAGIHLPPAPRTRISLGKTECSLLLSGESGIMTNK